MEITKFVAVAFVMAVVSWVIISVIGMNIGGDYIPENIALARNIIAAIIFFSPNGYLFKKYGWFPAFSLLYFQAMVFVGFLLLFLIVRYITNNLTF